MKPDFITFGAPDHGDAEIEAALNTLRSGWLGTGPRVTEFEAALAAYKGVEPARAVALNSCTAALQLSLVASGVGPGDEVVIPALTFCAAANAVLHTGATPVLADVDPLTMNLTAAGLQAALTPRTRAVMPVHFAGRPCEMEELLGLARAHQLIVIEDCAHAVESLYRGQPTGTFGDFGCFSFYATKNLSTGEGGMVIAQDVQLAERMRRMALHGMSRDAWKRYATDGFQHYDVVECGFKLNMMDLQATIGLQQLLRLENAWRERERQWHHYQQAFADLPVTRPAPAEPGTRHGLHLYTLLVDKALCGVDRDEFLRRMQQAGIGVGVHYRALPEHTYYRERLGWRPEATPVATAIGRTTVSLPIGPRLSDADVSRVVDAVRTALTV